MNVPPIPLSGINKFIQNNLVNRITININNTQSRNTLHHGKHSGNKLITPLPVTIKSQRNGIYVKGPSQQLKKLAGLLPMKLITSVRITYHYFLLWVGSPESKHAHNAGQAHHNVGQNCNNSGNFQECLLSGFYDPDFPGENKSSINEYLKENGNKGSNTLEFEEHSMSIEGSISDGNHAQLDICIRSEGFELLDIIRIFS
ncbi:hypothetical protein C1646_748955 [Rhizophagus diaphanus]|nr:hypothetical protein C1646_748955 [Rhizophagus diaphanus] [Rhizophagus sp. MUCL 43196]